MSVRLSLLCEWVYYLCEFYFELRWIVHILIDDLYVWTMRGVGSVGTYFLWSFTVNCDTLWDPEGPEFCCDVFPKPCPFPAAIPCFICPFAQIPFFFFKDDTFLSAGVWRGNRRCEEIVGGDIWWHSSRWEGKNTRVFLLEPLKSVNIGIMLWFGGRC